VDEQHSRNENRKGFQEISRCTLEATRKACQRGDFRISRPLSSEFRLLETTRVYAMDWLAESGALANVVRRHTTYFLSVLRHLDDELRSEPPDEYLAAFRRRADEVHGALDRRFPAPVTPRLG
jgi:hypothetical protein